GFSFREKMYTDLDLFGQFFIHLIEESGGLTSQMWRLPPQQMKIIKHPTKFISHFEQRLGTDKRNLTTDEVIWLALPDPADPWGALGPTEAWLSEIDGDFAMAAFQRDLFNKFGSPDWLLISKQNMSEKQIRSLRLQFMSLFGRLWGRKESVAVLGGDADLKALSQSPRDLQFKDGRESARDFIAQAYGVPKALLTSDDVNLANAREGSITFMRTEIWPTIRRVEDRFNQQLLPRFGGNLVLIHDNPIPEEREQIILEVESMLKSGHSVDEGRVHRGDEPLNTDESGKPMIESGLKLLEKVGDDPLPSAGAFGAPGDGQKPKKRSSIDDDKRLSNSHPCADHACTCGAKTHQPVGDTAQAEEHFEDENHNPAFIHDLETVLRAFIRTIAERVERFKSADTVVTKDDDDKEEPAPESIGHIVNDKDTDELAVNLNGAARPHIEQVYATSGAAAIEPLPTSISFNLQNTRAQAAITQAADRLTKSTVATFADIITAELVDGVAAGESIGKLTNRLRGLEGADLVRWKAEQIARTETGMSMVDATLEGWKQSGVVIGYKFDMAPGACPWCVDVNARTAGRILQLDDPLFPVGSQLFGTFQLADGSSVVRERTVSYTPIFAKIHPNCRCSLKPVLQGEAG
ncbi:MAG: phage portal protein, partial [Planctomycetes bacterium]|nr:phage portal protein [Planctomycetota bacterium]